MSEDLIARLEAASGPDRELDALIGVAVQCMQGPGSHGVHPVYKENTARFADDGTVIAHCHSSPYTASIDAALTLVPEGWHVNKLGEHWLLGSWFAHICKRPSDGQVRAFNDGKTIGIDSKEADAGTPALALCIAALKARAA